MESLKIVVLNRALNAIQNTYDWYRINLSISAANHFREGSIIPLKLYQKCLLLEGKMIHIKASNSIIVFYLIPNIVLYIVIQILHFISWLFVLR